MDQMHFYTEVKRIKKRFSLIVFIFISKFTLYSQVVDFDGNIYDTVTIVNQIWLKQNLKSIHYSDGTLMNSGGVFDYNNDSGTGSIYGKLYKYSVVTRNQPAGPSQGACPTGYRVASDYDWSILEYNLGGSSLAGKHIKDTILWQLPNTADNSSGFSALPAGYWDNINGFVLLNSYTYFWAGGSGGGYIRFIGTSAPIYTTATFNGISDNYALSCRCVKDLPVSIEENLFKEGVQIYPNPFINQIIISNYLKQEIRYTIISDLGVLIERGIIKGEREELNTSSLNVGMYILRLQINDNVFTKKIIKTN